MRYYDMKHDKSIPKYEFDCIILSRFTKKKKKKMPTLLPLGHATLIPYYRYLTMMGGGTYITNYQHYINFFLSFIFLLKKATTSKPFVVRTHNKSKSKFCARN